MENLGNNNGGFDVVNHQAELNGLSADATMLKTKQQSPEPNNQKDMGNEGKEKEYKNTEPGVPDNEETEENEETPEENERLRAYSAMEVQAKRRPYWAASRKVKSLDNKIYELEAIIRSGRKKIIQIDNRGTETTITKILTPVQIRDAKAKLEAYKLERKFAKEDLREAEFYYRSAVNNNKNTFKSRGRTFENKKEEKALDKIYNLLDKKIQEPKKDDIVKIFALKAMSDERIFNQKKFQYELKKCLGHLNKGNLPIIGITLEVSNKIAQSLRTHKNEKNVKRIL